MKGKRSTKKMITNWLGRKFPRAVQENKRLLVAVAVIFFTITGLVAAASQIGNNPLSRTVEKRTQTFREELSKEIGGKRSALEWTGFYLRRNLVSAVQIIGFGVAFGIYSLFGLILNGAMLGHIGATAPYSTLETFSMILPHGVFELTGYIIAISCGVKLGIGSVKSILEKGTGPLKNSGKKIKDLVPAVFILLIVAGIIEGALTAYKSLILNSLALKVSLIGMSLVSVGALLLWMSGKIPSHDAR